jgi:hypothetical protein
MERDSQELAAIEALDNGTFFSNIYQKILIAMVRQNIWLGFGT